jgi:hypothetical protein
MVGSVENGPVVEGRWCRVRESCDDRLVPAIPAVFDRLPMGIACGPTTPLTASVIAITPPTVATTKTRERMVPALTRVRHLRPGVITFVSG